MKSCIKISFFLLILSNICWSQTPSAPLDPICVNADYKSSTGGAGSTYPAFEVISNGGFITSGLDIDFFMENPTYAEIYVNRQNGNSSGTTYTGRPAIVDHKEASNGDIYVLGSFAGSLQVSHYPIPVTYTCPVNSECFFITRHNSNMEFLNSVRISPSTPTSSVEYPYVRPTSMTIDPTTGDIFVSGYFRGKVSIPYAGTYTLPWGHHGFIVRYSSTLGAKNGKVFTGNCVINDLTLNNSDLYVLGSFAAPVEGLTSAGSNDVFYGKYDFSLNKVWAKSVGSTSAERGVKIRYNSFTSTLGIVGHHTSVFDMNPSSTASTTASFYGGTDSFYASYSPTTGDFLAGKTILGGTGTDVVKDFELDGTNGFLITGDFDGGLTIPQTVSTAGDGDLFFARYKNNNVEWFKVLQNANPQSAVGIGRIDNEILVAGVYRKNLDMDPGPDVELLTINNSFNNYWGNFVARYECEFCHSAPRATITIEPGKYVCPGGSITINGTVTATGPWQLILSNNGGTVTGTGSGTWSKQVNPPNTTRYAVYNIAGLQDANCTGTSFSGYASIEVLNYTAGQIAGSQTLCSGEDPEILTAIVPHYGTNPRWQQSTDMVNWANIGSTNSQNYDPPPGLTQTTYYRKQISQLPESSNCLYHSNVITITVNTVQAAITPASATSFCSWQPVIVQLNANTGSNLTYQWLRNNVNISGATSSSYTATEAGSYTVRITNTITSCFKVSLPVTVNVESSIGSITQTGELCPGGIVLLSAGTGDSYQWYVNGTLMNTETSQHIYVSSEGTYSVLYYKNGCLAEAMINITYASGQPSGPCMAGRRPDKNETTEDLAKIDIVTIYPNPASNRIVILLPEAAETMLKVSLFSQLGNPGATSIIQKGSSNTTLNTSHLADGVYFVLLTTPKGITFRQKVLIKH